MVRILIVVGVAAAVFWIFSIVDTALSEHGRSRGIPKSAWLAITVILPLIGGAMWFGIGRPRSTSAIQRRMVAPDDDLDFVGGLHGPDPAWRKADEEELQRLEKELRDMDERGSDNDTPGRRDV